jgi:hypothetical protein
MGLSEVTIVRPRAEFKNSVEFAEIHQNLTDLVVTNFSKIGTIHIKVNTVQIKIGTVHLKFGKKMDSAMSGFFHPAEFLNTGPEWLGVLKMVSEPILTVSQVRMSHLRRI